MAVEKLLKLITLGALRGQSRRRRREEEFAARQSETELKTKEKTLTGRINSDTILLRAI